jgi:putative flippase GtrA
VRLRESSPVARQFGRFCVVGLLSVALNNIVIVVLTEFFGIHYLISIVLCFLLATAMGFALNRGWSFGKGESAGRHELVRYVTVTVCGIGLSLLTTWYLMQRGIPYYVTMVGIALIMAPLNFVAHKLWSFGLPFDLTARERAQ